jgi:hypothetical protein
MSYRLNDIERGDLCQIGIEAFYEAAGGLRQFPGLIKKVIRERAWERRATRGKIVELRNLRELITEKPLRGWGADPAMIERLIRDDPEALAMYREAMFQHGGDRRSEGAKRSNVMLDPVRAVQGNSRAYSIARVQRECDAATVDAVMKGRMSANAALVAAGLRSNRVVYLPRDPSRALDSIRRVMGDEYMEAMVEAWEREPAG